MNKSAQFVITYLYPYTWLHVSVHSFVIIVHNIVRYTSLQYLTGEQKLEYELTITGNHSCYINMHCTHLTQAVLHINMTQLCDYVYVATGVCNVALVFKSCCIYIHP